jgi:adenosine deaminase
LVVHAATAEKFVEELPKAEIHYHFEGSLQSEMVFDLASKNDVDLPVDTPEELQEFYESFDGLGEFLEGAATVTSVIQTAEDFERVTAGIGADAAQQNIPYREVFVGCAAYIERGIEWETVVEGIAAGRERARKEHGVELRFIPCVLRSIDPETGVSVAEHTAAAREELGVVGLGLAGEERGNPAHKHAPAYERAAELGLNRVAHAGEDAGPGSIWDALLSLDVARIDHGVRATEDEILLEYLDRAEIPLTVCPISNVKLSIYPELADHPIAALHDRGLFVTVNSDDPPMFGADLVENYRATVETFDLSVDDVVTLVRNSFEASFLDDQRTAEFCERVDREADKLRSELDLV